MGTLRLLFLIVSFAIPVFVILVIIAAALAFTGEPDACVDRVSAPSAAAADGLDTAWRAFKQRAASGQATIQITELQATSRGVEYVEEKDVPVDELQVYFCPDGTAEAAGKVSIAGLKSKVVVAGTLDLSGKEPRIQIDSLRAGSLPSAVAKPVIDLILNTGDFRTLRVGVKLLSIRFADGSATVAGGP
jgi:hypothetical protein